MNKKFKPVLFLVGILVLLVSLYSTISASMFKEILIGLSVTFVSVVLIIESFKPKSGTKIISVLNVLTILFALTALLIHLLQ